MCFLCVAGSIIMSPYMLIFYRMFSPFNFILPKSVGSPVRYIIISFGAIKIDLVKLEISA